MKNKLLKYNIILISTLLLLITACDDLDLTITSKYSEDNYWDSKEKAEMVLNMAYKQMYSTDYFFNTNALSDDVYQGRGSTNEKIITSGQADASNGRFESEWDDSYSGIKTCHTFLENVDKVPDMDENLKERMKAEIRFVRAFLYFKLTTWFGDIPLFDHSLTLSESKTLSRTAQSEVLDFVRKELTAVAEVLPSKDNYSEDNNGRITSGAAIALLARTYLYSNDWESVVTYCDKLINSSGYGQYGLFGSYDGVFLPENEYNNEILLDIEYTPTDRTWSNFYDFGPLSVGCRLNAMAPTQELVNDYIMLNGSAIHEAGSGYDEENPYKNRDPRLYATVVYHGFQWLNTDRATYQTIYIKPGTAPDESLALDEYQGQGTNSTSTGYYLRKYFDPDYEGNFASGLNIILIRYADVLLMYAEAKNELGKMTEDIWNTTIRALRERAGFTVSAALNYDPGLSNSELQKIIQRERRCELAVEGLRVFDIRRWKTAEEVLNGYPHGAKYGDAGIDNGYIRLDKRSFDSGRDYLWAVPQAEKDINPNLGQNPNY